MSTLNQELNAIKAVEDTLTANKVANFAYTQEAYDNNDADGVEEYDFDKEQNIPVGSLSVLRVNETVLTKGWRSQASAITRMLMNHFLGRLSYNLNKINDNVSNLLSTLISKAGTADGFATLGSNGKVPDAQLGRALANGVASLDSNGRIPYSQLPESAIEYKGQWNASTNTPTLADGTGTKGDFYIVSVAGTQDLGSGDIQFFVNDRVIYDGAVWSRLSAGDVKSVNNITPVNGNITLTKADVGLGNVDNTSDSDLPALNGTSKFTTAGAYNTLISIAPAFEAEQSYGVGNYVTYQGRLYKCTTAHTGAWDIVDFTLISVAEDLEKVAPLDYLLGTEQDLHKKWIDDKEVYRNIKEIINRSINQCSGYSTGVSDVIFNMIEFNNKLYIMQREKGIYITEDGISFTLINHSLTYTKGCAIYNNKLYVGNQQDIYVSENGITFDFVTSLGTNIEASMIEYKGKLYVATTRGLYVSSDGLTFTQVPGGIIARGITALTVFNDRLYVGTDSIGILVTDDGLTFTNFVQASILSKIEDLTVFNNKICAIGTRNAGGTSISLLFLFSESGSTIFSYAFNSIVYSLIVYENEVWIIGNHKTFVLTDSNVVTNISESIGARGLAQYKGTLFIGEQGTLFALTTTPNSSMPNFTVDQSVDSLIEIKLVVDGNNVNPLYAQKSGNQINLSLSSDSMATLFPAFDVYVILEYTKP